MKNNRQYIERMAQESEDRYFSADGQEWAADENVDNWHGTGGNADNWQNGSASEMVAVRAGQGMQQAPAPESKLNMSQPIIIVITNAATSAVANVVIYNSYVARSAAAPSYGNAASISITSGIANTTYLQILGNSETKNFKVGRTVVISETAGQVEQTFNIQHTTDTGALAQYTVTPLIDAYQQQTDRIFEDYEYLLDGYTAITFNSIAASTTVTVRLYLMRRFSGTQIAAGNNGTLAWSRPNISPLLNLGRR